MNDEKLNELNKSEVQESTINIEGDIRELMPTSEELYADTVSKFYEPNCY
jgi:hypothetical protein